MLQKKLEEMNGPEIKSMLKAIDNLDKAFFRYYTEKIHRDRPALLKKYPCSFTSRHVVPDILSESESCAFCIGVAACHKIYPEVKISEGLSFHPPLLSIVIHLSQYDIHVLLTYMLKWYKTTGLTENLARWFFVLLICLKEPVTIYTGEFLNILSSQFSSDKKSKTGAELIRLCYLLKCINSNFNLTRHKDAKKLQQYLDLTGKTLTY